MNIVLASNSPRRKELMSGLGIPYTVRVLPDIQENYPAGLPASEVAEYIAAEKAAAYVPTMADDELVITADTIVVLVDEILGKPKDEDDARRMLRELSGRTHHVITGVSMVTKKKSRRFSVTTEVTFKELTDAEIDHYVTKYHPLDKAGAYGVQEWIGYIGVTGLRGSYYNVMGFPIQRVYSELVNW
ncbi:MAG: septum formation protein Maf [Prevotella sp.]|nr:septum formation protein Maf [Prevotella sp.]MBQ9652166.1 septum formation protein Maf [Prevotella sp.]